MKASERAMCRLHDTIQSARAVLIFGVVPAMYGAMGLIKLIVLVSR